MLKKVKEIYLKLINKIISQNKKKKIFKSLEIGDMIWGIMPLPKKELEKIEKSHRIRPYLIVRKTKKYLLCYSSSSKEREEMCAFQKYCIKGNKYRQKKDSWLDLSNVKKIKIKNIVSVYIRLKKEDIRNIEKRLYVSQSRGNKEIIQFNLDYDLEIGDVFVKNNETFYVYNKDNTKAYCFKIQKKKNQELELQKIKINNKVYYTSFQEFKTISKNEKVNIINMANGKEKENIFNKKITKKLNNKEKIDKVLKIDESGLKIGTVFQYGNSKVMYLYFNSGKYYGADLLLYKIKPRIFEIKELKNRKLIEIKNIKEINEILEYLDEKNLLNKKLKNIYKNIRELLYPFVA